MSADDATRDDTQRLSHINASGEANMVDVGNKDVSRRTARAAGFIAMQPETLALIREGTAAKGDVLATARIAGIMAAKRTHELIPLCHQLALSKVQIDFDLSDAPIGVHVAAEVRLDGKTGVEMEALTAVSVACLTLYDMLKAADKTMRIEAVHVTEKTGGRSGTFIADSTTRPRQAQP
ncbi:MAG: cyclic pyranopterin monophosphate synthase MoaC [Pseudomonadota bacterium]